MLFSRLNPSFILLFSIICFPALAQPTGAKYFDRDWNPATRDKAEYYRVAAYDKYGQTTGTVHDYYIDGNLQFIGRIISDTLLDSTCTWYYRTGVVYEQSTFRDGKSNGRHTMYYNNGQMSLMGYYKNGIQEGWKVTWYTNGQVEDSVLEGSGIATGRHIGYYKSGAIKSKYPHYINELFPGDGFDYYENGSILCKSFVVDSLTLLEQYQYYPSGKIREVKHLRRFSWNIIPEGEQAWYYPNGNKMSEMFYKRGAHTGPDSTWLEDGTFKPDTVYKAAAIAPAPVKPKQWSTAADTAMPMGGEKYMEEEDDNKKPQVHESKDNVECLYGFRNKKEQWVLTPQFTVVRPFEGYYSIVMSDEKYGVVNGSGKIVIPVMYDNIEQVNDSRGEYMPANGWFTFASDNHWGLLNKRGEIILQQVFDEIGMMQNGCMVVTKDGLKGLADTTGYVLSPRFQCLDIYGWVDSGKVKFARFGTLPNCNYNNQQPCFGLVNIKGDTIIQPHYYRVDGGFDAGHHGLVLVSGKYHWGMYSMKGEMLQDTVFSFPNPNYPQITFNNRYAIVLKDSKYGIVDYNGKMIVPNDYDGLTRIGGENALNDNYILKKGNLYGILSADGKKQIAATYTSMKDVSVTLQLQEGGFKKYRWFLVSADKKYGLIDENDSVLIPLVYDYGFKADFGEKFCFIKNRKLYEFSFRDLTTPEDLVANSSAPNEELISFCEYQVPGHCGLAKPNGDVVLMPYYAIDKFKNGMAVFKNNTGSSGIVNDIGEIIVPVKRYQDVYTFYGGYAPVLGYNEKMGVVDRHGKLVVDTAYDAITNYDGRFNVCSVKPRIKDEDEEFTDFTGGWGLVNAQRQYIFDTLFQDPFNFFDDGLAIVSKRCAVKGRDEIEYFTGVVNSTGQTIIPFEYGNITREANKQFILGNSFTEDGMGERTNREWQGLVDSSGKILLPAQYGNIIPEAYNYYYISDSGKWGLANTKGQIIRQPVWDSISPFMGCYAAVYKNGFPGLIDSTGKEVINPDGTTGFAYSKINIADGVRFYYSNEKKNFEYTIDSVSRLIGGYRQVDGLKEERLKRIITNQALLPLFTRNFIYPNEQTEVGEPKITNEKVNNDNGQIDNDDEDAEDARKEILASPNKWRVAPGDDNNDDGETELSTGVNIISANNYFFSMIVSTSDCYMGKGGGCQHSAGFYNYGFGSNSLYDISLSSLFDTTKDYRTRLNSLLIDSIRAIKDKDIDCTNPERYLDNMEESFSITDAGLVFHLRESGKKNRNNNDDEDSDDDSSDVDDVNTRYVELTIPYAPIMDLLNKKSVLIDFLNMK